jgi:hypothetical protein
VHGKKKILVKNQGNLGFLKKKLVVLCIISVLGAGQAKI